MWAVVIRPGIAFWCSFKSFQGVRRFNSFPTIALPNIYTSKDVLETIRRTLSKELDRSIETPMGTLLHRTNRFETFYVMFKLSHSQSNISRCFSLPVAFGIYVAIAPSLNNNPNNVRDCANIRLQVFTAPSSTVLVLPSQ